MTTLIELQKEVKQYKNTLVIGSFDEIVRLIDVIDGESDFYWVYDTWKEIRHESCLIPWIPIKGFIPDDKYEGLVKIWNLNNIEKAI